MKILRNILIALGALTLCGAVIALGDYAVTQPGTVVNFFGFTDTIGRQIPAYVPVDTSENPLPVLKVGTVALPGIDVVTTQPAAGSPPTPVNVSSQYPVGAVAILGAANGTTGAVSASLPATANKTNFICGVYFSARATTTTQVGPVTLTGLIGGVTFTFEETSGALDALPKTFNPCLPANATNTAIVLTTTADASATAVSVNMWGFQQ